MWLKQPFQQTDKMRWLWAGTTQTVLFSLLPGDTETVLATFLVFHHQQWLSVIFKEKATTVHHLKTKWWWCILYQRCLCTLLCDLYCFWLHPNCFLWPTSFLPVSGDPIVLSVSRRAVVELLTQHNGPARSDEPQTSLRTQ